MRTTTLLIFLLVAAIAAANAQNFSNKGKEFWVGYGHNHLFKLQDYVNTQEMVLYLSAEEPATVKVSIAGTNWQRTYNIPANTVIPTEQLPKTGADDCRLVDTGLFKKGIHIESDVPIVAYAHTYGLNSSGATMLIPVESYGYKYISLNSEQEYDKGCYSFFYVIAKDSNTRVRITPSRPTRNDKPEKVPFEVNLQKGEVYNVMGAAYGSNKSYDLSGSRIQSIEGADGKCHPVAVFSGSSRTLICALLGGGDFIMQQSFPISVWGTRYLTYITSSSEKTSFLNYNKFRIYVNDPLTKVYRNGNPITGLSNNAFYEFVTNKSDYITADRPIMVAQFIPSFGGCSAEGDGDPEMFYLSPLEQAIKKVAFYNTNKQNILVNYLTLAIPQGGLSSLRIDGSNTYDTSYPHPNLPGYQVVIKQLPVTPGQHTVQSDFAFNAITYGLGFAESYGYNAGTYLNNLAVIPSINNNSALPDATHSCPGNPFTLSFKTIYKPSSITWEFSKVAGVSPATDVVQTNPVAAGSEVINGRTYFKYLLSGNYSFKDTGDYNIPVTIVAPEIENCSNSEITLVKVPVWAGPVLKFMPDTICDGDATRFMVDAPDNDVDTWLWTMGDGNNYAIQSPVHRYATYGDYQVKLRATRNVDACFTDSLQKTTVHAVPMPSFTAPAVVCLPNGKASFINTTTWAGGNTNGLQYQWTFDGGSVVTDKSPEHTYTTGGSHAIRLIATSAVGCADTTEETFTAFGNTPVADFTISNDKVCVDEVVKFTDISTIDSDDRIATYQWNLGEGAAVTAVNPTRQYTKAGIYDITLQVKSAAGCVSEPFSAPLEALGKPVVNAGPDVILSAGKSTILKGQVSDVQATFSWSPLTAMTGASTLTPVVSPTENQWYVLEAIGANECKARDSVLVRVFKDLLVPNAFSPNSDGINDRWEIPGLADYQQATVDVFNRWGQRVYHSNGYGRPWDGTLNGNPLPSGAYYYVIQPKENGYTVLKGAVLIIR